MNKLMDDMIADDVAAIYEAIDIDKQIAAEAARERDAQRRAARKALRPGLLAEVGFVFSDALRVLWQLLPFQRRH